MKFYDTHFDEYISHDKESLHPELAKVYDKFPKSLRNLKNIIFYGPKGVGKYTQMLTAIKRFSPSELKYEKKISIPCNKNTYFFKISDIHYEVDMSILGCNSKTVWNEVYTQIADIILAKAENTGIIVCKYFHEIQSELLESFYSYMQSHTAFLIDLKFILITEELSFIPDNILNCCQLINVHRPSRMLYSRCLKNITKKNIPVLDEITNMKNISANINKLIRPYEIICNKIINNILDVENMKFTTMRDHLYDIFIYNLNVSECILFILDRLIRAKKLKAVDMRDIHVKTYTFLQFYNNNYRPIYHLESYVFYLTAKVHGF
jgi:Cdc6-like AAA superfamily ATPase